MNIHHYSVFAAAPGGGKHVAVVEGVDNPVDMGKIAAESGAPLTGFILGSDANHAEVRFFSPLREKGSSDSGALVIAEHLRRQGRVQDRLNVQMGEERLEVFYQAVKVYPRHPGSSKPHLLPGRWWSEQGTMHSQACSFPTDELLSALGLSDDELVPIKDAIRLSGNNSKLNIMVPLWDPSFNILPFIKPDFETVARINRQTNTNGVIVFCTDERIPGFAPFHEVAYLRFFAPAKGITEDNAGSFTAASMCAYSTMDSMNRPKRQYGLEINQGKEMGKLSMLLAKYELDNGVAKNIQVGGEVELLEVTKWA